MTFQACAQGLARSCSICHMTNPTHPNENQSVELQQVCYFLNTHISHYLITFDGSIKYVDGCKEVQKYGCKNIVQVIRNHGSRRPGRFYKITFKIIFNTKCRKKKLDVAGIPLFLLLNCKYLMKNLYSVEQFHKWRAAVLEG